MRGWVIASSRRAGGAVAERDRAQALAVDGSVGAHHLGPGGRDLGVGGLAGRHHLARQPVGVDDRDAARREQARDGRFARPDASRQPDRA